MLTLINQLIGKNAGTLAGTALAFVLFFGAVNVSAQQCWTTAGSAGTVDETALGVVELNPRIQHPSLPFIYVESSVAGVKSSVASAGVGIYYNVVAVDGLFGGELEILTVRFGDNGTDSKVIVELKQKNLFTGTVNTLARLNSDDFAPSTSAQIQQILFNSALNFAENIYYIETSLVKTGSTGKPTIHAIQICSGVG